MDTSFRALARAKILQMLIDLGSRSKSKEAVNEKTMAECFILNNPKELNFWCDIAEMNPWDVKRKAKEILENGYTWRAEAGKGKRYEERLIYRQKIKAKAAEQSSYPSSGSMP